MHVLHRIKRVVPIIVVLALLLVLYPAQAEVTNGSFETGDFSGWTTVYTGSVPYAPWTVAPTGTVCLWGSFTCNAPIDGTFDAINGFDGDGPANYQMWQDSTVPADMGEAWLSFSYRAQWDYAIGNPATQPRTLQVSLIDTASGTVIGTPYFFSADTAMVSGNSGWISVIEAYPVTPGQQVRVMFDAHIPQAFTGPGQLEIDAVSLSFYPPALGVPNLGLVQINATAGIQPYGSPGLEMQNFVLPADYDGNGYDTYTVTEVTMVGDEYWLGLFIGSGDWVYVPYSAVIPLTPIAGIN